MGWTPWSKQVEAALAIEDEPLVALVGANGVGKDAFLAVHALYWTYAKGGLCIIQAPTQRQVREVLFGEIGKAWYRAKDLPGELFTSALRLGPESDAGILGFTSSPGAVSKLTGFHGSTLLGVLSEAQGLEQEPWEGMMSCLVGPDDRLIASGNPLFPSGRFYEAAKGGSWKTITIPAASHPNIVEGRTVIPGGPSSEWIERMESEYGTGSNTYHSRVLSEFPDQGEEALISRAWLESAAERWESGELQAQAIGSTPILSVDPARYGPDSTVCAARRGMVIETLIQWRGLSTMETVARIEREAAKVRLFPARSEYNCGAYGEIVVDVVGIGAGIVDRLKQLAYRVQAFNGGHFAANQRKFLNLRAASYWNLRTLLEEGRIALPRDQALWDELLALKWFPTSDGKVQLERKQDLKNRLGRSPDKADAVSMALGQVGNRLRVYTVHI